ncbi:MAG: hypothetical protein LBP34_02300 [Flavobacteriaceae bacterium]|jgi:hypothetical protein|nr:hypothetical protein [Flavobacteriaceae bacterium]
MKNKLIIITGILLFTLIGCNEDNTPIDVPQPSGAVLNAPVGGPAEPNQVWVDLDLKNIKVNQRDAWDFGFYNGDEFVVVLNTSILMAAGKTEFTDIDKVTESDVTSLKSLVGVGTFQPGNMVYVDDIKGNYQERTAIEKISSNDDENKVYLVNMGHFVYTGSSTDLMSVGDSRGWKKIRVLRNGTGGYKIQYADISDTTHQEISINKGSADYDFTFLSLTKGIADIQPPKNQWDLCFTVFVNETKMGTDYTTYTYADFITINSMNNTGAYQVMIPGDTESYDSFTKDNVDYSKFIYDDQRVIGGNWRTTPGGAKVYTDRFYVLKDNLGTLYKIRFLNMTNSQGHRGYPQFEYDVLLD